TNDAATSNSDNNSNGNSQPNLSSSDCDSLFDAENKKDAIEVKAQLRNDECHNTFISAINQYGIPKKSCKKRVENGCSKQAVKTSSEQQSINSASMSRLKSDKDCNATAC